MTSISHRAAPASRRSRPPALIALCAAHTVSLTGNAMTLIAVPLHVLNSGGSAWLVGVSGVVATAPVMLGGLAGGVVVDRVGFRRAAIGADLIAGLALATVPVLEVVTAGLPLWGLLVLVFASGVFDTPAQSAREALLPEIARSSHTALPRAVALIEACERGARLLGAPLAGFLVAFAGTQTVFALDAASFLVSTILVATGVTTPRLAAPPYPTIASPAARAGPLAGLRFLFGEPLLRSIIALLLITNLFDAAKTTVLLPLYTHRYLPGPFAFGLLIGTMGGGALAGSLLFGVLGHRIPRRSLFVVCFFLTAAPPYAGLCLHLPLTALAVIFALSGLAAGAINPIIGTIKLERVPPHLRARTYGAITAACQATMPLGAVLAGTASQHLGLTPTLLTIATIYTLATLTPLITPAWRTTNTPALP